jgi:hypothetical protein
VAVAHVGERVGPAQLLVAGVDVDHGVAARTAPVVEVIAVDVRVHAADVVDRPAEAREVHADHVVDRERAAADRHEALDGLERARRAGALVGGVDPLAAAARGVDEQVARDRRDRGRAAIGVQPDEHDRVGARRLVVALPPIGADDHQRLRLPRLGLVDLDLERVPVGEQIRGEQQHRRRHGAGRREADQDAGE